MSTALAVAVLLFLALGATVAVAVVLRLLIPRSTAPALSVPGEGSADELSLRSSLPATVRVEPTPEPMTRTSGPGGEPAYDPSQEIEDDVPTTLFRDDDSQELAAYIADFDSDHKER